MAEKTLPCDEPIRAIEESSVNPAPTPRGSALCAHRILENQRRLRGNDARPSERLPAEDAGNGPVDDGLDSELARAEEAYKLMLVADACLRSGADRLLLLLGFSQPHVDELRAGAGVRGGYPTYAIRKLRKTLHALRKSKMATDKLGLMALHASHQERKCL